MVKSRRQRVRRMVGRPNESRPGLAGVMIDAFNITQDRISRSRLAGDPPDVMLGPRLGKVGLFDFHRADELIAKGAEAAQPVMAELKKMLEPVGS